MSDLRTFRSVGVILISWGSVAALIIITLAISFRLPEDYRFTPAQTGTIWLLIVACAVFAHIIARSRVTAGTDGLEIVNGIRKHYFAWTEIATISMPTGAPWPTLVTHDDRQVILFGIQGSEGASARAAVDWLREHVR